jgi:hypothetical protein
MLFLLACCLMSACGAELPQQGTVAASDQAQRLLARTLSVIEAEQPAVVSATTEVIAADGYALPVLQPPASGIPLGTLAQDPYEAVKLLQLAQKSVILQRDAEGRTGMETIRVAVAGDTWNEWVQEAMRNRSTAMQLEGQSAIGQLLSQVSRSRVDRLERELNESFSKAQQNLAQMTGTLEAEGVCNILLKPGSARPLRLTIENRMRYMQDGRMREETVRTIYQFR